MIEHRVGQIPGYQFQAPGKWDYSSPFFITDDFGSSVRLNPGLPSWQVRSWMAESLGAQLHDIGLGAESWYKPSKVCV